MTFCCCFVTCAIVDEAGSHFADHKLLIEWGETAPLYHPFRLQSIIIFPLSVCRSKVLRLCAHGVQLPSEHHLVLPQQSPHYTPTIISRCCDRHPQNIKKKLGASCVLAEALFWFRVGLRPMPHDPDSAQIRRENMQQSETNKPRAAKSLAKPQN